MRIPIPRMQLPNGLFEPRPLDEVEQKYWTDRIANTPDEPLVTIDTDPALYEHVLMTQLGRRPYNTFNPIQYQEAKAQYPPGSLLYQGPDYPLEEEQQPQPEAGAQVPSPSSQEPQLQSQTPAQVLEQQDQQPPQPTVDRDGDVEVPDRHVLFTPENHAWVPEYPMYMGGPKKSNLKEHAAKYELGPDDKLPQSPIIEDYSPFVREEEQRAAWEARLTHAYAGHTPARRINTFGDHSPISHLPSGTPLPHNPPGRPLAVIVGYTPKPKPVSLLEGKLHSPVYSPDKFGAGGAFSGTSRFGGALAPLYAPSRTSQASTLRREEIFTSPVNAGVSKDLGLSPTKKRGRQMRRPTRNTQELADFVRTNAGVDVPVYGKSSPLRPYQGSVFEPEPLIPPGGNTHMSWRERTGRYHAATPLFDRNDYSHLRQRASEKKQGLSEDQPASPSEQLVSPAQHASPSEQLASPAQHASPSEQLVSPQQYAQLPGQYSPPSPQQASPSLKRASPTQEDEVSIPQQHISPSRKIISPTPRRPRPSATELYPELSIDPKVRYPQTSPAPEELDVRRVAGNIVWTFAGRVGGYIVNLFNNIRNKIFGGIQEEQTEVIAVATDMSDTKRRAIGRVVSSEQAMSTPSPQNGDVNTMPGFFSDSTDSEEETDKVQRAQMGDAITTSGQSSGQTTSTQNEGSQMTKAEQKKPQSHTTSMQNEGSQMTKAEQKKPQSNITPPDSRPSSKQENEAHQGPYYRQVDAKTLFEHAERRAKGEYIPIHWSYPSMAGPSEDMTTSHTTIEEAQPVASILPPRRTGLGRTLSRRLEEQARNKPVDGLVRKANELRIESAEQTRFRLSVRINKERIAEKELAKEREEEAKIAEEKARIEAEKELDEIRQQLQKDEEEIRQKQEQEAAEKAARKALEDQLIRPLDPKWEERVANAMASTNGQQVFATSPDGVDMTRYILGKILPQKDANGDYIEKTMGKGTGAQIPGWLDDESINAFFATIVARKLEQTDYKKGPTSVPAFVAYNTAWYKTFNDRGVNGLKTWSRRKAIQGEKLLSAERIFFPLNVGNHWVVLIISPQARKIEFLDSGHGRKEKILQFARDWLKMELGEKYHDDEWTTADSRSNKQLNFDDCGVFTCMNALASAKNKEFSEVSVTKGMMDARRMIVAVLLNGGFTGDWEL